MKQAIMALDGGGSNLRMLIVDRQTQEEIYFNDITTGTNLSTVPNKEEALRNIKKLIIDGFNNMPSGYALTGIGLSSAGTEIEENKIQLEQALAHAIEIIKKNSNRMNSYSPRCYVTNDIDVLLHSADIALVAGTGTVGAVKYKDIKPYDNTEEIPEDTIYRLDGNGPHIGDKGSGYWIAKEVLTKVAEIENLGGYVNSQGEFVEVEESLLRDLVFDKLFKVNGIDKKSISKKDLPEYVSLVYSATTDNGRPFDRAKVGNLFSKIADEAAQYGDEAANDILKQASIELFKNIRAAYEKGDFENKEECNLLLSGSVLVHSEIVRYFLESVVKEYYPNVYIKVNKEKPVWSTIKWVDGKLKEEEKSKTEPDDNEEMGR